MLLPLVSAGLGGYSAYRQSGGDLGATLLGTGVGAVTPGVLRMAGTALGGMPVISGLAGRGAQALAGGARNVAQAASGLGKEGLSGAARTAAAAGAGGMRSLASRLTTPAAIGGLVAGTGLALGAPQIAGQLVAGASPAARKVAGLTPRGEVPSGFPAGPAVPVMDQFGNVRMYGSDPYSMIDPFGPFQASLRAQEEQSKQSLRNLQRITDYEARMLEGAKKADLERGLAAAGIRQNIATQAALLQGGVGAAQQMGQTAMENIGRGLTQLYQYQ